MALIDTILSIILTFPPFEGDKNLTIDERRLFLKPVATAIAIAASDKPNNLDIIAAEITIGWFETRFAKYVIEGRCLEGRFKCDLDPKTGKPRAYGFGQVWSWCRAAHEAPPGSVESINATALCVAQRWSGSLVRCSGTADPIAGAFSGYRNYQCSWPEGAIRAKFFRQIRKKLGITKV